MIPGRFGDTSGRPYVEGRLHFPRFDLTGDVSFLVDTGADASLVSPGDASRIGADFDRLEGRAESVGLGGPVECFVEPAWIVFAGGDSEVYVYALDIEIAPPSPDALALPSLLGRDILDRWRMVYDPAYRLLEFEVRTADLTIGADA